MKISNDQSREIYELASDPVNKMTNREIGLRFGISESSVRHHTRKWEKTLHAISLSNKKLATALANRIVNMTQEATDTLDDIKESIKQARREGVSPEKLSSLYSCRIRSLECIHNIVSIEQITKRIEILEGKKACP